MSGVTFEGVGNSVAPQDVIDYCQAWYTAVNAAGFVPGIYVGYGSKLTGQQLFDLSFQHYWRSQSTVPAIPERIPAYPIPSHDNRVWSSY